MDWANAQHQMTNGKWKMGAGRRGLLPENLLYQGFN
jgi:hypothetical protein